MIVRYYQSLEHDMQVNLQLEHDLEQEKIRKVSNNTRLDRFSRVFILAAKSIKVHAPANTMNTVRVILFVPVDIVNTVSVFSNEH